MNNPAKTSSRLTVDESEHMRAAMLALLDTPVDLSDVCTEEILNAASSLIRIIGISLDPTQTGYDFAIETVEFRDHGWFRYLGFSSFTKWCERYNFSPRTISGYMKTFNDLSVDRAIDLEVYEHLSLWKVQKLVKPLLADEPKQANPSSNPEELTEWIEWIGNLETLLETAK
ncbi:MAG: hypothetical protein IIA59_10840 [Candidatus Marinimicrobia bacterium]|nr:hypothetical protein [Candidatus Neomarinimicrobiota bacterium]